MKTLLLLLAWAMLTPAIFANLPASAEQAAPNRRPADSPSANTYIVSRAVIEMPSEPKCYVISVTGLSGQSAEALTAIAAREAKNWRLKHPGAKVLWQGVPVLPPSEPNTVVWCIYVDVP